MKKIRDSHDLIKNLVKNEYLQLLNYNRERVIDNEDSDGSNSSIDDVSSEDDELTKKLSFEDQIKLAIVRGMRVQTDEKEIMKKMILQRKSKNMWAKIGNLGAGLTGGVVTGSAAPS